MIDASVVALLVELVAGAVSAGAVKLTVVMTGCVGGGIFVSGG
jgi:hypothetical protein